MGDPTPGGDPGAAPTLRDRCRGCLLGGAVGDALGAPVEFMDEPAIRHRYGPAGITDFDEAYGRVGAITDDTQMTLFTAEGLIRASVRWEAKGICGVVGTVDHAYLRWLRTQGQRSPREDVGLDGGLVGVAASLKPGKKIVMTNGDGYEVVPLAGLRLKAKNGKNPNLDTLIAQGYRWGVYSDASDVRYLRSPDRFPEEALAARAWMAELASCARLVKHFPRRPLPGWDLPGSTANMYHQPDVRIYRLNPPPGRRAR